MERFTWSLDVQKTIRGGDPHFRPATSRRSRRHYFGIFHTGACGCQEPFELCASRACLAVGTVQRMQQEVKSGNVFP